MKIKMLGSMIGVVPQGKARGRDSYGLVNVNTNESNGVIKFLSEDASKELKIGQTIYYGDKYQRVQIQGESVLVMESENVVAVVEEDESKDEKTEDLK